MATQSVDQSSISSSRHIIVRDLLKPLNLKIGKVASGGELLLW